MPHPRLGCRLLSLPAGSVVTAKVNLSINPIPGTPETFSWAVYDRDQAPVFGLGFGDVGVAWVLAPGATHGGNILYGPFSISAARLLLSAGEGMTCSGTRQ